MRKVCQDASKYGGRIMDNRRRTPARASGASGQRRQTVTAGKNAYAAQNSVYRNAGAARKKGSRKKAIKVIAIVWCVLLVCCLGAVLALYGSYKEISKDPLSVLNKGGSGHTVLLEGEESESEYVRQDHMINILLLGIDTNDERESQNMGWRSDVIILCSLNFDDKTMDMVTIPRDTYVSMNKLDRKTGEIKSRTNDKINAAYAYGGGPKGYGAKNSLDCVKEFLSCSGRLDIQIDYYATIDMDGIPKLVDAVGGVEVTLDAALPGYGKAGQTVTITGKNVDTFVRNRKEGGGGDPGRNSRQQKLIIALAKKIKSMGAVDAVTKLYNEVITYMQTNVSLDEALALASFLQGFNVDAGISQYRLETSPKMMNGIYYEMPDEEVVYKFALEHFYMASPQTAE